MSIRIIRIAMVMADIDLMRRAATIAANTRCWIGSGCVIARGKKILVEAWNETLLGEMYCMEFRKRKARSVKREVRQQNIGCIRHELHLSQGAEIEKVCSIHAEANAIAKAAKKGISLDRAMMFVTSYPCLICMRSIIASGIKKVVYMNDFYKPHNIEFLEKNKVLVHQIHEEDVWRS